MLSGGGGPGERHARHTQGCLHHRVATHVRQGEGWTGVWGCELLLKVWTCGLLGAVRRGAGGPCGAIAPPTPDDAAPPHPWATHLDLFLVAQEFDAAHAQPTRRLTAGRAAQGYGHKHVMQGTALGEGGGRVRKRTAAPASCTVQHCYATRPRPRHCTFREHLSRQVDRHPQSACRLTETLKPVLAAPQPLVSNRCVHDHRTPTHPPIPHPLRPDPCPFLDPPAHITPSADVGARPGVGLHDRCAPQAKPA
mgnify:CR=1 FL=1